MNIKLSKDQFEKLLELVYLGNWVVNSHRADDRLEDYDKTAEHILSFAPAAGLKDRVDFDEFEGRYFPSRKLEESLLGVLDDYDDFIFWNLLVERLAERDLIRKYGEKNVERLEWDDYNQSVGPFLKKYEKEIDENGLDRLEIFLAS
jgi:hypothetical protein